MANIRNNWCDYFTKVNYQSHKCNICSIICSWQHAPIHLHRCHKITDQVVLLKWNDDNDLIWQHFFKEDLFSAECKFCGKLLKSAYSKRKLDTHLRAVHSQEVAAIREDITRTWVSPHFTFDHECKINCMYCEYSGKIYDGVDVLKNHLKEFHDLDENFVHLIGNELDYLETIMQCTTEESNVATSFQDGNTH